MIPIFRFAPALFASFILLVTLIACQTINTSQTNVRWEVAQLATAEHKKATIEGSPKSTLSPWGPALSFNGIDDRLLVAENPIFGAEEFTIEAVIFPNDVFPENIEPRFFHIESADIPNRRITMELRLNANNQWYFDAYIKSDVDKYTLVDKNLVHPTNQWVHTAITYKNKKFTSFVNGNEELSAEVQYLPIAQNAQSSIGARMNQVHWFNGSIYAIHVHSTALNPQQFKLLPLLTDQ